MGLIAQRYQTALLQKADPLPPGRYWIDVFGSLKGGLFGLWLKENSATVKVENTSHYEPTDAAPEGGDWTLFNVSAPTKWGMSKQLGWPTVADANVVKQSDTVQRPPEITPGNYWSTDTDKGGIIPKWVPWAVGGTIVVAGVWGLAKLFRD